MSRPTLGRTRTDWRDLPAHQQPDWRDHPAYEPVLRELHEADGPAQPAEIRAFAAQLASVCAGEARLLQAGDCAESFAESAPADTVLALAVLDDLARRFAEVSGLPVVRIGRIGGQFAKPRSAVVEEVDGVSLAPFRGHMINSEIADAHARTPDPHRMGTAHRLALAVHRQLATHRASGDGLGPWSSHEALVVDYESAFARTEADSGELLLTSTHFPWIGERTRQPDHAHVRLLAATANPLGCKLGPDATGETAVRLCELLNPDRIPGRLTFIVRMGADRIGAALPPVVRAVRGIGHPVIWVSDPMHGNTIRARDGRKTRELATIAAELREFCRIIDEHDAHVGGVHLEVARTNVTECLGGSIASHEHLLLRYRTLCDPRLNPAQAARLLAELPL